jgi:hypothetical protein
VISGSRDDLDASPQAGPHHRTYSLSALPERL